MRIILTILYQIVLIGTHSHQESNLQESAMYYLGFAVTIMALLGTMGLAQAQVPDTGEAAYDVLEDIKGTDAVVKKYGEDTTLQCEVDSLSSYQPMQWYREEKLITADPSKYEINTNNGTLTIIKSMPEDVGEYVCVVNLHNGQSFNQTINLYSIPYVHHFEKSKNLVQGDPLVLECLVEGNPMPTIEWFKDNSPLDVTDQRLSFSPNKDNVDNGTLRLEDLDFDDRAEYMCVATNRFNTSSSVIQVRVKDKLAALWPFLGICAEVAILVIIIFIYERRRAKKLEELDAKEEADHLTNSHSNKGGDEVRQRK